MSLLCLEIKTSGFFNLIIWFLVRFGKSNENLGKSIFRYYNMTKKKIEYDYTVYTIR